MKTRVDARLREEAERFVLRHTCDDCCHFGSAPPEDGDDGARCGEGWPTAQHRLPLAPQNQDGEIVFCKEFEMT